MIGDTIDATVASVVIALPVATTATTLPAPRSCAGIVYQCGDSIDNDADGLLDADDPECLGPCDNSEDSYSPNLPGGTPACDANVLKPSPPRRPARAHGTIPLRFPECSG